MGKFQNLSGKTFNRLTVTNRAKNKGKDTAWHCVCSCGTNTVVTGTHIKSGHTKSCGCMSKEMSKTRALKHGMSKTKIYGAYNSMISRCHNKNSTSFSDYGGKGIFVCDEWRNSFIKFYADMGACPDNHNIDRINNEKGYSFDNCRWASDLINANNKSNNRKISFIGVTLNLCQWAKFLHMEESTLALRIDRGWTIERAIMTNVRHLSPPKRKKP